MEAADKSADTDHLILKVKDSSEEKEVSKDEEEKDKREEGSTWTDTNSNGTADEAMEVVDKSADTDHLILNDKDSSEEKEVSKEEEEKDKREEGSTWTDTNSNGTTDEAMEVVNKPSDQNHLIVNEGAATDDKEPSKDENEEDKPEVISTSTKGKENGTVEEKMEATDKSADQDHLIVNEEAATDEKEPSNDEKQKDKPEEVISILPIVVEDGTAEEETMEVADKSADQEILIVNEKEPSKDEKDPSKDENQPVGRPQEILIVNEKEPSKDEKDPSKDENQPSNDVKEPSKDENEPSKDGKEMSIGEKEPSKDEKEPSNDEKESSKDEKEKDKPDEVISISDGESEEGEGVGAIRIRDFNSLMEIRDDDDDDDDDVIEIPHQPTPRIMEDDLPDDMKDMDLECEEDRNYRPPYKTAQNSHLCRKKLSALHNHVKELSSGVGGLRVVRGAGMLQNVSHLAQNQGRVLSTLRGYTAVPRQQFARMVNNAQSNNANTINVRMTGNRNPISIVRGRNVTAGQHGKSLATILNQPNNTNAKQVTVMGMNGSSTLTQLIFDPTSGLLLCPTPGGGNTMQALRPTSHTLQTIQNASQLATHGFSVTGTRPATSQSQTNTASIYNNANRFQPRAVSLNPTGTTVVRGVPYQPIAPAPPNVPASLRAPASASFVQAKRLPIPSCVTPEITIRPPNHANPTVRFANARTIAAYRNIKDSSYGRPAVAPTASAAVKLMNQQKLAAANAAIAEKTGPSTGTAGKPEEVTAGSLQAVSAPDKDPHNSKTFPSLVVMVKPCLQDKVTKQQQQAARAELDIRVKSILMYTPSKFTEWLMQKGLLRVEHRCAVHGTVPFKLGMYSDGASKQPFSGGYVWISDCCPDKQVSVFQGSIFEASVYPPGTLMKLIYHWSCQTPATNALQWVKVTSYYLKNFYTLLRSACVAGLHQNCKVMGGIGKYIEIGIITLGTTVASTAGQQKQVKIEILGVFDPATKSIRMKVINPQSVGQVADANNERIRQIVYPLNHWVDKKSVILIDTSMDKSLLEEMGFSQVSQSQGGVQNQAQKSANPTNVNVMNYLKNVVPKMFQNTLCVLSKSLIQQFLDELSWREMWGGTSASTFDNIVAHLVQMTLAETGENLISRLNKISLNPFAEWSFGEKVPSGIECLPDSIRGGPDLMSVTNSANEFQSLDELASNYMRNRSQQVSGKTITYGTQRPQNNVQSNGSIAGVKRKYDTQAAGVSDLTKYMMSATSKVLTLQTYYYAWMSAKAPRIPRGDFPQNLKCPLCSKLFVSNHDAMRHIMVHVVNVGRSNLTQAICVYCLKELSPAHSLQSHINESHKLVDIPFCCRICNEKFASDQSLILHMWQHHVECECPFRCEVCEFRSSYHYEVVDHFHKEHLGLDCVQCPVCMKVLSAKSFACLKMLVVHLQNHMIKKGRKCLDCCLVFSNDHDLRSHIVHDIAHDSRLKMDHNRQKVLGDPILMSKPPTVNRAKLPPPTKRARADTKKSASTNPSVTTLNSELSIPINPAEKFAYDKFPVLVTGLGKGTNKCWECGRDMTLAFHYTGLMKCTKCKYNTHCSAAMTNHTKLHQTRTGRKAYGAQCPKPIEGEEVLCCDCGFNSRFQDKLAAHLLICDHFEVHPLRENDGQGDEGPPVLQEQLPIS